MGLKYNDSFDFLRECHIKIRPLWDWNKEYERILYALKTIKIRPLWDWNPNKKLIADSQPGIKIRPLWDWNNHNLNP